jgi:hypothetical protein
VQIDNRLLDKSNLTQPGTYLLILENRKKITLSVGALGEISFPKGYNIYVGSAFGPGGLRGRLRHHISTVKQPRWHVDYLRPQMTLSEIWYTNDKRNGSMTGQKHFLPCLEHPSQKRFRLIGLPVRNTLVSL